MENKYWISFKNKLSKLAVGLGAVRTHVLYFRWNCRIRWYFTLFSNWRRSILPFELPPFRSSLSRKMLVIPSNFTRQLTCWILMRCQHNNDIFLNISKVRKCICINWRKSWFFFYLLFFVISFLIWQWNHARFF